MQINPNLEIRAAASDLAARRWVQVKQFLTPGDAEHVHQMLAHSTPWGLVFNSDQGVIEVSADELATMDPAQVEMIFGGVVERAQTKYQYIYGVYPILSNICRPDTPQRPIADLWKFLNSKPVLDWFRTLTGRSDVQWIDAQATMYQAGHFLKSHSDLDDENNRIAAYVMNFTKVWERDWGGYLQFFNAEHDIEHALRPIFNALNVFMVPIDHSVGIVAPFAYEDRLSVTGWLRSDSPPEEALAFLESRG
jgi:hypothetical protein